MAKFYGAIGFVETKEDPVGSDIWVTEETVKEYTGDLTRNQRRWVNGESVNQNLELSNEVSILLDDFFQENLGSVRWVEAMGSKWKVQSVIIEYPRVKLTLGGVYNGD